MNIKPWVAVLAIMVFGTLLAGIFWTSGEERAQQGPTFLRSDQQGDLYVVFHENIFRLSPNGQHLRSYRLDDLGVGKTIGGLDFFRNGEVLLRTGSSVPNLYEQILIQLRIRQPASAPGTPGDRLSRCNLDVINCAPLAGFTETFKRTFRVAIDANDNVFISDTGRESVYWLDSGGHTIAEIRSGFRLPNQLVRDGDRIVVTNTNRHELTFIPLTTTGFAPETRWHHLKVNTAEARRTRETWPMDLLKVGDEWLVLSQGSNMAFGDVFRFSEDGRYRTRFNLPAEVDPTAIAKLGSDVIVVDYAGMRLLRYSDEGLPRGELVVPEIARYAAEVRAESARYALYQSLLWILFAAFLVAGFAAAIVTDLKYQRDQRASKIANRPRDRSRPVPETPRPTANDPDIHWIGTAASAQRRLLIVCILFGAGGSLIVAAMMSLISRESHGESYLILFFPMFFLAIALVMTFIIGRKLLRTVRIGVLREWLIVCDWRKRVAIGRGDDIVLTSNAIAIESVSLPLGHGKHMMLFDRGEWAQWVEPRLTDAQNLTGMEILTWNWKHQRSQIVTSVVVILVLLAWTLTR